VVNGSPVAVEAVRVQLEDVAVGDLRRRLAASRLVPDDGGGWERGIPRPWLADLLAGWQRFDTGAFQARLDRLTHLRAVVGEQVIHLVHAPGHGPAPLPLVLTHGWPSSSANISTSCPCSPTPARTAVIRTTPSRSWRRHCPASASPARPPPLA
jgi:hypothetical protein